MFALDDVVLRPLEASDLDCMYRWHLDLELEILSGWGRRQSRTAFDHSWQGFLADPPADLLLFGIVYEGELVGRIELAKISRDQQTGFVGFFVAERTHWGKGIATRALRILLDYAFTVENLYRVTAETYAFNTRSQRVLGRVGFEREGVLRQAEVHNGDRQDMVIYGMLKPDFYGRYATLLAIPQ